VKLKLLMSYSTHSWLIVGCGSSCIYPLLAHQINKWKFIATEVDPVNLQYAKENVEQNNFQSKIDGRNIK